MQKWTLFSETDERGDGGDSYHHCDASKQLDVRNETEARSDTLEELTYQPDKPPNRTALKSIPDSDEFDFSSRSSAISIGYRV